MGPLHPQSGNRLPFGHGLDGVRRPNRDQNSNRVRVNGGGAGQTRRMVCSEIGHFAIADRDLEMAVDRDGEVFATLIEFVRE